VAVTRPTIAAAGTGAHGSAHALVLRRIVVGRLHDHRLARQPRLAGAVVVLEHLDGDLVTLLEDVAHLAHAVGRELADVEEAVEAGEDLDEGAERLDAAHRAGVGLAHLGHLGEALDDLLGAVGGGAGRGVDLDLAVVLDLDLAAGLVDDAADGLATGADDVADLVDRDLDHVQPRRETRHLGARGADGRLHLAEDVQPSVTGLLERHLHDLARDAGDLDVHLQGGDAVAGAGDLEVHVAVV